MTITVSEPEPFVIESYPENANPFYQKAVFYVVTKETYNWSRGGVLGPYMGDERVRELRGDYGERWLTEGCVFCFGYIDFLKENAIFWRHPSRRMEDGNYAHFSCISKINRLMEKQVKA